ncbi:GIP, partial [Symbiodinium pilosum]
SDPTDPSRTPDGSVSDGDGSGGRDSRPRDGAGESWTTRVTTPTAWTATPPTARPRATSTEPETYETGRRAAPSEKMAVPSFNAESSGDELGASARSYLRQVDAWTKVTRLPEEQRALVLYQHLQGRAWIEAEELDVDIEWRPKARLVVGGHKDPDAPYLVTNAPSLCDALKDSLNAALPVDEWLDNQFEYLGSRVVVEEDGVTVDQELYTSGRLFTVDIGKEQHDLDPATREQYIDNMSAIGALSWLASQTRPDLQAGVSMAQQLQRQPLVEDLRFTNSLVKKAWAHREESLRLKAVDLASFEILAYHDAAWANTGPATGQDPDFMLYAEDELDGVMEDSPFKNKERKAKRSASKVASQFGVLIMLADSECTFGGEGNASILEWRPSSVLFLKDDFGESKIFTGNI